MLRGEKYPAEVRQPAVGGLGESDSRSVEWLRAQLYCLLTHETSQEDFFLSEEVYKNFRS